MAYDKTQQWARGESVKWIEHIDPNAPLHPQKREYNLYEAPCFRKCPSCEGYMSRKSKRCMECYHEMCRVLGYKRHLKRRYG